jgi:hypothetical protein
MVGTNLDHLDRYLILPLDESELESGMGMGQTRL